MLFQNLSYKNYKTTSSFFFPNFSTIETRMREYIKINFLDEQISNENNYLHNFIYPEIRIISTIL